jgi:hypothetical protein
VLALPRAPFDACVHGRRAADRKAEMKRYLFRRHKPRPAPPASPIAEVHAHGPLVVAQPTTLSSIE